MRTRLLDERSRPDFRDRFGESAREAVAIDVAVRRIRLAGLDLEEDEIRSVRRLRVLVGEVSALTLAAEADAVVADRSRARTFDLLLRLFREGRIETRCAPLAGWTPDFSIFHGASGPARLILGFHWFQRPFPHPGPALATVHGPADARTVLDRFEAIWEMGHDVRPAIHRLLEQARERSLPRSPGGPPRPAQPAPRLGSG